MNREQIQGNWKSLMGKVREKWGDLTDDDVAVIDGKREQLLGSLERRYGMAKEEAERQVKDFEKACRG
jgi:uncharacterized protein YjbJ (UPF0337 family)